MQTNIQGTVASDHLNLMRGVSALAVLVAHIRYQLFLNYHDVDAPGILQRACYAMTSFGHDAVMVFFVLSGFLVGSKVVRDCEAGRWSFSRYATGRIVRLCVVLVPGLLLCALWDTIGLTWFGDNAIYTAAGTSWVNDYFPVASRLNVPTFFGNLLFLQTIVVQPFGSNEALWSLSNEFWYYALFPCLWVGLFDKRSTAWTRGACLAAAVAVMWLLTPAILIYFPIWSLGLLVGMLPLSSTITTRASAWTMFAAIGLAGVLVLTHWGSFRAAVGDSLVVLDYINACTFALVLYAALHCRAASAKGRYQSFSTWLAGFSFTLYVAHLPMLNLLHAWLIPDRPWAPDLPHLTLAGIIGVAVVGFAWMLAQATEATKDSVRQRVNELLQLRIKTLPARTSS